MKRNFVVSLFGSLIGFGMLFILLSAAGIVGARSADIPRDEVRPNTVSAATPLTSTFTYQGQLKQGGSAVTNPACQIAFRLYDAVSSGNVIGSPITPTVPVTNGLFTVGLNFGSNGNLFDGNGRWLDIQVNCGSGFVPLLPRQPLTAAPYAFALRGLYTQQNATSPNLIGGYSGNAVTPGVYGVTIGGGGRDIFPNSVIGNFGTVGGGVYNTSGGYDTVGGGNQNTASGGSATVGGGLGNTASGYEATVGGGTGNTASGTYAMVGGGRDNIADGIGAFVGGGGYDGFLPMGNEAAGNASTISGGLDNIASGNYATVPGGISNSAAMSYTLAAGRRAKANHDGAFVWADSSNADFASTANDQFLIRASGGVGINGASFVTTTTALQVDKGNILVRGKNNFAATGDEAILYFGDTNHYIKSVANSGVRIGTYSQGDVLTIRQSNGSVGIGITGPAAAEDKLEVNGIIRVDSLGGGGATSLCRNASNQIAYCSSSLRYKSNLANLNLGLDTVAQLRPVTFDWKGTGEPDLGFVAEEVDQVTPLLTTRNVAGQIEGVKYDRISAVLVKAVQEQQQQIAAQQNEISDLQARLANLDPNAPPASFNWFNLLSMIAFTGFVLNWLQQRRSKRGQA